MNSKTKILVTGADGFIGSHLAESLVKAGQAVRAMVMYNAFGHRGRLDLADQELVSAMEIFPADIRDQGRVKEAMTDITHVFHLASLIGIPYSYHAPESYVETNVRGTLNLLQAARERGVTQFIHTSTSEVYGTAQTTPMNETHPLNGQSPYAASKIGADQMAQAFYLSFELPVTTIRPFNTYGPRQSARAIIPTVITQIASGVKNLQLGSIRPRRDLTFVDDIVAGFIAALDNKQAMGETINLGSSADISMGGLVDLISKIMEVQIEIETDPVRVRPDKSEVEQLLSDCSKARELLHWKPVVPLSEGIIRTVEFFNHPEVLNQYRPEQYEI